MTKVSAGVNRGRTPGTTPEKTRSRRTKISKNMTASKHIDLAPIISGTPSQVREKFKELEENGDLIRDEACEPTDPPDPSELLNLDSEVEITDEDAPAFDNWENERPSSEQYFVFRGERYDKEHDDDEDDESALVVDDCFKLVMEDRGCSPDHAGIDISCRQGTRRGMDALFAFMRRCKVLESIAKWLENDRAEFLNDNSWVNLGPKDYEEVKEKRVTVIQESFLEYLMGKIANKAHQIDKSQFSRYLENCRIVWPDKGGVPVKNLFCKEAKNAWAAKSIMIFAEKYGKLIADIITQDIKAPKTKPEKEGILCKSIDSMDINEFIIYTNLVTQTSWNNIKPILEDLDEKKRRNT